MRQSNEDKKFLDPVALDNIVMPITWPNGQMLDLVTTLQIYKKKFVHLKGEGLIECPLTRAKLHVQLDMLKSNNLMQGLVDLENFKSNVGLPDDMEIISFIIRRYNIKYTKKYIKCTDNMEVLASAHTDGLTLLMVAAQYQQEAVAPILKAIADKDKKDKLLGMQTNNGWTALMIAAKYQQEAVAPILKAIADLANEVEKAKLLGMHEKDGWTALMIAVLTQPEAVAPILKAITDLSDEDKKAKLLGMQNDGWTALMIAKIYSQPAVRIIQKSIAMLKGKRSNWATSRGNSEPDESEGYVITQEENPCKRQKLRP